MFLLEGQHFKGNAMKERIIAIALVLTMILGWVLLGCFSTPKTMLTWQYAITWIVGFICSHKAWGIFFSVFFPRTFPDGPYTPDEEFGFFQHGWIDAAEGKPIKVCPYNSKTKAYALYRLGHKKSRKNLKKTV